MNGAESLVHTLLRSGVDTCFANPGTSEMHFVAALDRVPGMRCVLGLFEGVVTGAADGYARMAGKPAATLLHCGPGLANGLANLHNARRASTPIVNIVGDQATYHRPLDAPLTADTEGWARGVSGWVRTATSSRTVGADAAAAVQAARTSPGQIATLILPSDTSWDEGGMVAEPLPVPAAPTSAPSQIDEAAGILRRGGAGVLLLLSGTGLSEPGPGLRAPHRRAHRLPADGGRLQRTDGARPGAHPGRSRALCGGRRGKGAGRHEAPDPGRRAQAGDVLRLSGQGADLGAATDADMHVLARPEQDIVEALARLAEAVGAPKVAPAGQRAAAGGRARRADAGIGGAHGRRADAGGRGHRRRVGDLSAAASSPTDQSGAAA